MFVFTVDLLFVASSNRYPFRLKVFVAFVVSRENVHLHRVCFVGVETMDSHGKCREHSPVLVQRGRVRAGYERQLQW